MVIFYTNHDYIDLNLEKEFLKDTYNNIEIIFLDKLLTKSDIEEVSRSYDKTYFVDVWDFNFLSFEAKYIADRLFFISRYDDNFYIVKEYSVEYGGELVYIGFHVNLINESVLEDKGAGKDEIR